MDTGEVSQSIPDTATLLDARLGLRYAKSISLYSSLLTSTKPLYGPFPSDSLAYSLSPALDLCIELGRETC